MPDKVTYYAVVNDLSSRDRPAGVFRRIYTEGWRQVRRSIYPKSHLGAQPVLISAERGDLKTSSSRSPRTKPTRSWNGSGPR